MSEDEIETQGDEKKKPAKLHMAMRANAAVKVPIVFEDGDLLVVDKPAGMVTQPGKGHASDSLMNGLFVEYGKLLHNLGERRDYGLLHRLDKETSGLLVIAKSPNAYDQLRRDFEARKVDKEYLAVVAGIPKPKQGVVQARLKEIEIRNEAARGSGATIKKVVIHRQGQEAISAYQVVAFHEGEIGVSLVRVTIKTGRLHQIRAHMQFLGCQVFGDSMYAAAELVVPKDFPRAPRLCLHAARLAFKHPISNKWVRFESYLPRELVVFAEKIGLDVPGSVVKRDDGAAT